MTKARIGCVFLLLTALTGLACRADPSARGACPRGFTRDEARAARILGALGRDPEGARVRDAALERGALGVCFGPAAVSVVTTERVALLDEALGDDEAAARLGHLLRHVEDEPLSPPTDGGGCDEVVRRALAREAEAIALELRLRRALGVASPKIRYELEDDFWATSPDKRERLVLGYLEAHPDGAPGIDALASGYARRCRLGLR